MRAVSRSGPPFVYEELARGLGSLIDSGTFRPGDRVPSVRRMSAQQGVSIASVVHAYRLLEAQGRIAARPQSGFYVVARGHGNGSRTYGSVPLPDPGPVANADLILRVLELVPDPGLVPLGTALPDPALLPVDALARALGRVARRGPARNAASVLPAGAEELRHAIVRRALAAGCTASGDDVVVTAGCTEAISLTLRALARPGDTIAVESPTYYGTLQILESLRLRAVEIPVNPGEGMDLAVLDGVLTRGGIAAVVVTPSVHNPLGCVMPDRRKRELAELLAVHGVPAIEDDTYGELAFGAIRPRALASFDRAGLVLLCGSFSKTLAPAYRTGWVLPGRWREQVLRLKFTTSGPAPVPPQLALAEYLGSGGYEQRLRRMRRVFQANLGRVRQEVESRFPPGTSVSRPAGGYLLWVGLPGGAAAVALQRAAARFGLSVAPGPAFSAGAGYERHVRINAGYLWSPAFEASLDLLRTLAVV
jgi:DNA-binding transcriptional MocR family regulator